MFINPIDVVSSNLKFLRLSFNYSQTWVARRLNICRNSYILYESGQRMPCADVIINAAQLYGVSLNTIMLLDCANADYIAHAEACRTQSEKLMDIYMQLSPFGQGSLMERARALEEQEVGWRHPLRRK